MLTSEDVNGIGEDAGSLWEVLSLNGPSTIAALKKTRNLSEVEIQRAIGWLAREDKILFQQKGKSVLVALK